MGSRKIEVQIVGDSSSLGRAFRGAAADTDRLGSRMRSAFGSMTKAAVFGGVIAGVAGLTAVIKSGASEWAESAKVQALVEAHIASTGGAAHVTAAQIDEMSQSLLAKTGVDDEVIKGGASMLLMFQKVRNEAGQNGDVFNRATAASVDLAASLHQGDVTAAGVAATSKALGRALNDPIGGMGGLARVGVKFTEGQKATIASMVKSNHLLDAQNFILDKVKAKAGGAAEAIGKTLAGKVNIARQTFRNLSGEMVGLLAPSFNTALTAVNGFLAGLNQRKGFQAKVAFVWDQAKLGSAKLAGAIGNAVAGVNWASVWSKAKGVGDGFATQIEGIDWAAVGARIGDGLSEAVDTAIGGLKGLPTKIERVFKSVDWEKIGIAMGPGIAAALASAFVAITSPSFWIKHWDLALAVALTVFGGKIGGLMRPAAGKIVSMFSEVWAKLAIETAGFFAKFAPRLAGWVLEAFIKLPGIVGGALSGLVSHVARVFSRMAGRVLGFVVKVLGIQAAIDELVKIGGRVKRVFSGAASWLVDAGEKILQGLWDGLKKKWTAIKEWFSGIRHTIASWVGLGGGGGGTTGATGDPGGGGSGGAWGSGGGGGGGRSLSSAMAPSKSVQQLFADANRAIARGNAELLRLQRAQEDASNLSALHSAKTAADIANAKAQIEQTRLQREIDDRTRQASVYQAQLDKMKAAAEKWHQMMQAARERSVAGDRAFVARLAANLETARTRLGASYDRLASQVTSAFQRIQDAWVSPSQQILDASAAQRQHEDLVAAVDDSAQSLLDAQDQLVAMQADGVSSARDIDRQRQAVTDAQRRYQRAQEDLANEGLAAQAAIEKQGHDDQVAVELQNLQDSIDRIRTNMLAKGTTVADGTRQLVDVVKGFDPDFKLAGDQLGGTFADALLKQIKDAITEANKLRLEADRNRVLAQAARDIPGFVAGQWTGPSFESGGPTGDGGLALLHPGEFVVPAGGALVQGGSRSSSTVFNITVQGGADSRMTGYEIRDELLKIKRREPDLFG